MSAVAGLPDLCSGSHTAPPLSTWTGMTARCDVCHGRFSLYTGQNQHGEEGHFLVGHYPAILVEEEPVESAHAERVAQLERAIVDEALSLLNQRALGGRVLDLVNELVRVKKNQIEQSCADVDNALASLDEARSYLRRIPIENWPMATMQGHMKNAQTDLEQAGEALVKIRDWLEAQTKEA